MASAVQKHWVFNIPKAAKGWILDAICREIGARVLGRVAYEYNPEEPLPPADVYFFAHYWNYLDRLKKQPEIVHARVLIWYTHPREIPYTTQQQIEGYAKATQLICTNSVFLKQWLREGLPRDRACVVLGGADPHLFELHKRGAGAVGLSSSYYPRKGAERIHDVVRGLPSRQFHLLGRNWQEYPEFAALRALANFRYTEAEYKDYPALYRGFDVFLSMSLLEGGPIPVLETMMSNAVPVASRTGFAQDLISDGHNGYTFDVNAPTGEVLRLVEKAFSLKTNIRETVLKYSWENFAYNVIALAD